MIEAILEDDDFDSAHKLDVKGKTAYDYASKHYKVDGPGGILPNATAGEVERK
jgi:hypothetical protein